MGKDSDLNPPYLPLSQKHKAKPKDKKTRQETKEERPHSANIDYIKTKWNKFSLFRFIFK